MQFFQEILKPVLDNQIATGLSLTAAMGGVLYQVRQVPKLIKSGLVRYTLVRMTVKNTDPTFVWVELWLSNQSYGKRATSIQLKSYNEERNFFSADISSNEDKAQWAFSPSVGTHWFIWNKKLMIVDREVHDVAGGNNGRPGQIESIEITTFGRSQNIMRELIAEAQDIALKKDKVSIKLYRNYWTDVPGKTPRPFNTVVLKDGQKERILSDIEHFLASKEWYTSRGLPWRRGYLLSGKPGTGKTSFVLALAGHLHRPVCVLNLGSIGNDNDLFSAVLDAPKDAILLIEDIDCALSSQVREKDKESSEDDEGISKAGLLNALDGVTTPDGKILIMTTNHPELLDEALVRPGRADVHEEFEYLGDIEQLKLAQVFYGEVSWVATKNPLSPAEMQSVFMNHPKDVKAANKELLGIHSIKLDPIGTIAGQEIGRGLRNPPQIKVKTLDHDGLSWLKKRTELWSINHETSFTRKN